MVRHDADAALRFPGPDYHQVLKWIHQELKPELYLEIGVLGGGTLKLADSPTIAIGIDPVADSSEAWPSITGVIPKTSSQFFASGELAHICRDRRISLAFIDGLHIFEQCLSDVLNLERYAAPNSVFALHDTIPLNRETSERTRTTEFYTGDVWKTVAFLRQYRPELEIVTITAPPAGLTLIRGLRPTEAPAIEARLRQARDYARLDWGHFEAHHDDFLNLAPNDRLTIQSFCQKTPVQSMISI
jgi:hypothetical protein